LFTQPVVEYRPTARLGFHVLFGGRLGGHIFGFKMTPGKGFLKKNTQKYQNILQNCAIQTETCPKMTSEQQKTRL